MQPTVAGPAFCREPLFEFILVRPKKGRFTIRDTYGSLLLSIEEKSLSLRRRTFVRDSCRNLILTIREKTISSRDTWYAFRGDDENSLWFYTRKSGIFDGATPLNVFLAGHDSSGPRNPDFVVTGSCSRCIFDIHAGATHVAKIRPRQQGGLLVSLVENVDYVLVSALIAILDLMEENEIGAEAILDEVAKAIFEGVASVILGN